MPKRADYCSDTCHQAAEAGRSSYAPCPLANAQLADKTCAHCGWYVPASTREQRSVARGHKDPSA